MPTTIDIRDLPHCLDEALAAVAAGAEIILAEGSTPRDRLVPVHPVPRSPGLHPGAMIADPSFDAALPDDFWAGQR